MKKVELKEEEETATIVEKVPDNTTERIQYLKIRYRQAIYKWISMIALLSVINAVLEILNVPLSFPIGFGINFIVSGVLELLKLSQDIVAIGGFITALLAAGSFFVLGRLFQKGKNWALYTILVLYILDTLLTLVVLLIAGGSAISLLIDVGFHVYAIYRIVQLFRVYRKL
jgi:hypothetical protein